MIDRLLNWLFRARVRGASLSEPNPWQLTVPAPPSRVLASLAELAAPSPRYVYFEGSFDRTLVRWFATHSVPAPLQVSRSTIWPRPDCHHVPLEASALAEAAAAVQQAGDTAPVTHLHVHDGRAVLVEWNDAFGADPIYVSRSVPEEQVRRFAAAVGGELKARPPAT